jgi:hypothetical protein
MIHNQNPLGADLMAVSMAGGAVGANLGFRRNHLVASCAEMASIARGEDAVLRRARIFNGFEPDHQNGLSPIGGFSAEACRPVEMLSLGQWDDSLRRAVRRHQEASYE